MCAAMHATARLMVRGPHAQGGAAVEVEAGVAAVAGAAAVAAVAAVAAAAVVVGSL